MTIIERVARCEAEYHGSVYGTQCQLAASHGGPHWAVTKSLGVIIWNGDSRDNTGVERSRVASTGDIK